MENDFKFFFNQYENLVEHVDSIFNKVKKQYPKLVQCTTKCADCCYALFDISLIEALYINNRFRKEINLKKRQKIIEESNIIDRKIHKLKRKAQNSFKKGKKSSEEILYEMAISKIKCPLLDSENLCKIYKFRPITCRIYGIPTSFSTKGHTCGFSGFKTGKKYPTINLDIIHNNLYNISKKLIEKNHSKYIKIAEILMPISMALLTEFDFEYLGIYNRSND